MKTAHVKESFARNFFLSFDLFSTPYLVSIFIEEKGEQLIWSLQLFVATEQRVYDLYTSCFMSFM